jgi:hypothetical protein
MPSLPATRAGDDTSSLLTEISMWICLNDAFLSIVTDTNHPDQLLVSARRRGDIERLFGDTEVSRNTGTDYRYRARLPRVTVARAIAGRLETIDYGNFKDSVTDTERHAVYFHVWSVMYRYQTLEYCSETEETP